MNSYNPFKVIFTFRKIRPLQFHGKYYSICLGGKNNSYRWKKFESFANLTKKSINPCKVANVSHLKNAVTQNSQIELKL